MSELRFFAASDEALYLGPPASQQRGESHHGRSLFPPPPTTFQGMVRTHLLLHGLTRPVGLDPAAIAAAIGGPERLPPAWELEGPWVAGVILHDRVERLWPWVPTPLAAEPSHREGRLRWCDVAPLGDVVTDRDALPALVLRRGDKAPPGWIPAEALWALLSGGPGASLPETEPPFVRSETRPGLQLDPDTRAAMTSRLYFREARRLGAVAEGDHPVLRAGFAASLRAPDGAGLRDDALTRGVAHLGRRKRPLALQPQPRPVDAWERVVRGDHLTGASADRLTGDARRVWLLLASPATFDPSGRDGTPARPVLPPTPPVRFEIEAAALGEPVVLGGLDMTSGRPKPNRAFLPAGSAWVLRVSGGTAEERRAALRALHHRCTIGSPDERSFGCGRTWVTLPFEATP